MFLSNFAVMRAALRYLAVAVVAAIAVACGRSTEFTASVTVEGLGAEEVEVYYFSGPTGLQRVTARADEQGRFSFKGSSASPTLVEIYRSSGEPLICFMAANGDKIKASMIMNEPGSIRLRGNDANVALSDFIKENSRLMAPGKRDSLNAAITAGVVANPGDLGSTLILMTLVNTRDDAALADSLFNIIAPEARPASLVGAYQALLSASAESRRASRLMPFSAIGSNDSLQGYVPASQSYALLAFTGGAKGDSVTRALRRLNADYKRSRLLVMEVAVWGDSAQWRHEIKRDSARWRQTWVAGGPGSPAIERAAITRLPYFIVADSMGRQLLRTPSIKAAAAKVDSLLKK